MNQYAGHAVVSESASTPRESSQQPVRRSRHGLHVGVRRPHAVLVGVELVLLAIAFLCTTEASALPASHQGFEDAHVGHIDQVPALHSGIGAVGGFVPVLAPVALQGPSVREERANDATDSAAKGAEQADQRRARGNEADERGNILTRYRHWFLLFGIAVGAGAIGGVLGFLARAIFFGEPYPLRTREDWRELWRDVKFTLWQWGLAR